MNCDALRNRLLSEPDPTRVPAELRPHLDGCESCGEYLARYAALAKNLAVLPVPPSELAKIAFTEHVTSAGPIIRSVPSVSAGGYSFQTMWRTVAKPLAVTAAAVAVGVGGYFLIPTMQAPAPEYVAVRHDLLKKVVATNTALARTSDPKVRIATLTDLAGDLRSETRDMLNAADEADFASLAGMFEDVISKGLVSQAKQLNKLTVPTAIRVKVLNEAAEKLAAVADDANEMARNAPPQAKTALKRISTSATQGRMQLIQIRGEGV